MRIRRKIYKMWRTAVFTLTAVTAVFVMTGSIPAKGATADFAGSRRKAVTAAGATFPAPLYSEAFRLYWEHNDIPVTYAGIGTERGFRSLRNRQIDFAGVDVPPTRAELDSLPGSAVLLPVALGAVEIAYHLDGVDNLRLSGEVLADIYLGKITKWNDARIAALNDGQKLPDKEIYPVFRLDGSGTTYVFTHYLSQVSPEWKSEMGTGKNLKFPRGAAANGTPGVARLVERIPGAIGYVSSGYAISYALQRAQLRNAAGNYVQPTPESITAAAEDVDATGMITNAANTGAYPISCFTWVLLYKEQEYAERSREEAQETVSLLRWLISAEAQALAPRMKYAPLSTSAAAYATKQLESITYGGKKLK